MKVVFTYPELTHISNWKGSYHFGVASLISTLKQSGHQVSLIHLTKHIREEMFLELLQRESPFDLLAFSSTTNEIIYVKNLSGWAKKKFSAPIICGGAHATTSTEDVISSPSIDMVCVGEGEPALKELCQKMEKGEDYSHTPNLLVKTRTGIIKNTVAPLEDHMDTYPFGDRETFHYDRTEDFGERRLVIMASRGCPFDCTYCINHLLLKKLPTLKNFVRFRSVANVIEEIKVCLEKYPWIERIMFHDDVLTLKKKWFSEFVEVYKKEVDLPFACNSRANMMNDKLILQLKEAGCVRINMGIESGNERLRNMVLKRNMTNEHIMNAFELCRKRGIKTYAYNMVGLPYETFHTVLDTVKINARVNPSQIQTSIFYPYPNTELYNICIKEGFIEQTREVTDYFEDSLLSMKSISRSQILFAKAYFPIMVFFYRSLLRFPGRRQTSMVNIADKVLSSPRLPFPLLMRIGPYLSIKTILRNLAPAIYDRVRPLYKKFQYR